MCSPALGDTLLFSAAAQDLRKAFPDREIVHLCMKQNAAAAALIGGINRRILINLTKIPITLKTIRSEKFDVLLDFTSWQRLTAFYTLMSGAKFTAGFKTHGQHRGRGYDLSIEHRDDRHEVDNFRALLHGLNIQTECCPKSRSPHRSKSSGKRKRPSRLPPVGLRHKKLAARVARRTLDRAGAKNQRAADSLCHHGLSR